MKTFVACNFYLSLIVGIGVLGIVLLMELSVRDKIIMAAFQAAYIALSYLCVRRVDGGPTALLATLAVLHIGASLWNELNAVGEAFRYDTGWAAALCLLAFEAAKLNRLAKKHPDLYFSKRMRGEHLTNAGKWDHTESISARRRREKQARQREDRIKWLQRMAAMLFVTAATTVGGHYFNSKESPDPRQLQTTLVHASLPSPVEAIERFRVAWNAGDIRTMALGAKASLAAKLELSLKSIRTRYGWGSRFPPLEPAEWHELSSREGFAVYPTEVGEFPVRFVIEEGRWVFRSMITTEIKHWRPE